MRALSSPQQDPPPASAAAKPHRGATRTRSAVDQVLAANRRWADSVTLAPSAARPNLGLAVVTCMDARLDFAAALGLAVGDANILRNAGGRVTLDVVRSLAIAAHVLGVREVGIVHHTDCRLKGAVNSDLAARTGLADMDFLPFDDIKDSIAVDVDALIRARALVPGSLVWGALYEVETGVLTVVSLPAKMQAGRPAGRPRRRQA